MDLSIVIVNWNSVDFLRSCLKTIYKHTAGVEFEVVVIDNASYDGSAEMLEREYPDAVFLQGSHNLGFSKANNLAYQYAKSSTILFLNPDTELLNDAITKMYTHLHSRPEIGAVGCRLVNSDLSVQTRYVQAFPTLWNQILRSDLLIRLFPKARLWGCRPLFFFGELPAEVEVVSGSCVMVKRDVFEKIGHFDEDYFMYAEDVALCHAIRRAGYSIHFVGEGSMIHHGAKSSTSKKENHFASIMQRESLALFFQKTRSNLYASLYKASVAVTALFRLTLITMVLPFEAMFSKGERFAAAGRKWVKILRWSLGLEQWATAARPGMPKRASDY